MGRRWGKLKKREKKVRSGRDGLEKREKGRQREQTRDKQREKKESKKGRERRRKRKRGEEGEIESENHGIDGMYNAHQEYLGLRNVIPPTCYYHHHLTFSIRLKTVFRLVYVSKRKINAASRNFAIHYATYIKRPFFFLLSPRFLG